MVHHSSFQDARVLEMILSGEIIIRALGCPRPQLYVRGRLVKAHLYKGRNNPRYCWDIHDCYEKKGRRTIRRRRKVQCNKLVWMYFYRRLVPPGHEIHHLNEDRLDDSIGNLECWDHDTHHNHHYGESPDDDLPD